jgi:hypothetical protein
MPRYHRRNSKQIQYTAQEEADRDAEEAAFESQRPMMDWTRKIKKSDYGMPRYVEDILDGMADKSGVAQITLDRLQAKKDLRATKP